MGIRAYNRIPSRKKVNSGLFKEGGCPELLYDLLNELTGAYEINIAAYLFNNEIYFNHLSSLAKKGCKVNITSLPLDGYNNTPKKIEGYNSKISARQLARGIYKKIRDTKNISLNIFSHQYTWHGPSYAGNSAPYSFHVKAIYAKFRRKKNKCILHSANFMVSDQRHSDNIIIFEGINFYERTFERYFKDLYNFTIPQTSYTAYKKHKHVIAGREINLNNKDTNNCFFTAPFYTYNDIGSNHLARNKIIELISGANKRVWICAQHFHDLNPYDSVNETIVNALYKRQKVRKGINFKFLKQGTSKGLSDQRRAAIAETLFQFVMGVEQRHNKLIHDKFMLIDDKLIVSTANYTPTQFAFWVI